jgi:DNA-binding CsgD family transcriptional regulator
LKLDQTIANHYELICELARSTEFVNGDYLALSKIVIKRLSHLLAVERVGVWFLSPDGEELVGQAIFQKGRYRAISSILVKEYPIYLKALKSSRSLVAHDAYKSAELSELASGYLRPSGITSMLDSALREGDQVIGVLCLEHIGKKREWQISEINLAGVLSDLISSCYTLKQKEIAEQALTFGQKELQEANITLRNLLTRFEEEKRSFKESIALNIERNVRPLLAELEHNLNGQNKTVIARLESALMSMTSEFHRAVVQMRFNLSPTEVKVCQLISSGMRGKEIAEMLNLSFATIETHKKNIRKKLGIQNRKVNLRVYLEQMEGNL